MVATEWSKGEGGEEDGGGDSGGVDVVYQPVFLEEGVDGSSFLVSGVGKGERAGEDACGPSESDPGREGRGFGFPSFGEGLSNEGDDKLKLIGHFESGSIMFHG